MTNLLTLSRTQPEGAQSTGGKSLLGQWMRFVSQADVIE